MIADTDTAFGWLAERDVKADRMGVVGFDLGGSVALFVAATRTLGAAVTVGNEVPSASLITLVSDAAGPHVPVARDLRHRRPGGRPAAHGGVVVRGGDGRRRLPERRGHRFDDDPDNAAEAWQRTLNWFDSHLR